MAINYPNGKQFLIKTKIGKNDNSKPIKKVNYSNRGMSLEDFLNETNIYYMEHRIALIHKKPTPIQVVKVDYPQRSAAVIKEAYYKLASTTDYNGVFKGKYIDFEAKETNQQSFPLKNMHEHQIKHMKQVVEHGGIAFALIYFTSFEEIYLIPADRMIVFWERMISGGRKSVTRTEFAANGSLIKLGFLPRIDYLKEINHMFFEG
ncbi:MAG: recU [Bacillales bacterium]|jgi:recombination protein U|nr:recU [Bacillales bacterium]